MFALVLLLHKLTMIFLRYCTTTATLASTMASSLRHRALWLLPLTPLVVPFVSCGEQHFSQVSEYGTTSTLELFHLAQGLRLLKQHDAVLGSLTPEQRGYVMTVCGFPSERARETNALCRGTRAGAGGNDQSDRHGLSQDYRG
jgi:hypothetical protein